VLHDTPGKPSSTNKYHCVPELSGSLEQAVVLHIFKDTLERVPFFCNKHPQFISQIVSYLNLELYSAGDYVVRQDDVGTNMYFISGAFVSSANSCIWCVVQ
jgi:hypothetical protein